MQPLGDFLLLLLFLFEADAAVHILFRLAFFGFDLLRTCLLYTSAFVFIEINTLAAAGLVMMRQGGRALVAGVRYMMMNLLGSSLFLIGCVILYTITGHLLLVNIRESVAALAATGQYHVPLTVVVSLSRCV